MENTENIIGYNWSTGKYSFLLLAGKDDDRDVSYFFIVHGQDVQPSSEDWTHIATFVIPVDLAIAVFGEMIQFNDMDAPIYCVTADPDEGEPTEPAN